MEVNEFDLIAYLDDRQIDYGKSGTKDVGKGWVGIHCPFPHCSDTGHHCGINRTTKVFKCYICGEVGGVIKLITALEECSFSQAHRIMEAYPLDFPDDELIRSRTDSPRIMNRKIIPEEASKSFPGIHTRYLESRGFDPDKLIRDFDLYAVYNIGRYRGRIIIPMRLNGRLVTFTTRDITGASSAKYIDQNENDAIVPVKRTLYNIDKVPDYGKGILVEGPADVWQMGDGTFGSCTSNMTDEQKLILARKKLKRLFIMYDADAEVKARKLAVELNVIQPTELILLDSGDPADLSPDEARQIRRDLLS